MVTFSSVWGTIAGMGMAALKSFLRTVLLLFCEGVILGIVTYYWLMDGFHFELSKWGIFSAILAVAMLLECILVGLALAGKRAVAMALIHALRVHRLGQATVRLVFQQLLGVTAEQPLGERGGMVAQTAERVPLAQVERRLNDAIRDVLRAEAAGGGVKMWVRRQLQRRMLGIVQKFTLARFREADAQHGGVDLVAVQAELESSIDDRLIGKLKWGVDLWTAAALVLLPLQACFGNYLLVNFVR
jgi:hypothetical protein